MALMVNVNLFAKNKFVRMHNCKIYRIQRTDTD